MSPPAAHGCSATACWTLRIHFDRCIPSLVEAVQRGSDRTCLLRRFRVALASTVLCKPAIYTSTLGIRPVNDTRESAAISFISDTRQQPCIPDLYFFFSSTFHTFSLIPSHCTFCFTHAVSYLNKIKLVQIVTLYRLSHINSQMPKKNVCSETISDLKPLTHVQYSNTATSITYFESAYSKGTGFTEHFLAGGSNLGI